MRRTLTDALLRSIPIPSSRRIDITDERCQGLTFRVTANGSKSWCFRFRDPRSGRPCRFTLGHYPDVSLSLAREHAADLRRHVAAGANPHQARRHERESSACRTFGALADRYIAEHARRFKRSATADERNLRLHVLPSWRDRPYEELRRREVIALCERMVAAGTPTNANR